jgi:hypothetical protein
MRFSAPTVTTGDTTLASSGATQRDDSQRGDWQRDTNQLGLGPRRVTRSRRSASNCSISPRASWRTAHLPAARGPAGIPPTRLQCFTQSPVTSGHVPTGRTGWRTASAETRSRQFRPRIVPRDMRLPTGARLGRACKHDRAGYWPRFRRVVPCARAPAGGGVPGPVQLRRGHRHRRQRCRCLDPAARQAGVRAISALALSIDNLAVGFALGTYHVALLTAAVVIGAVSVAMAFIGLELGRLAGTRIGERGEALGGVVLLGVGIAIAAGLL